MSQQETRQRKEQATDLIPKGILLEARNIVFSCPQDSYEEKLRKLNERVYSSSLGQWVINPRHTSMALDEALKTF